MPDEKPKKKSSGTLFVIIIFFLAVAGGGAYYVLRGMKGHESTDDAALYSDQVVVSAEILGRVTEMYAAEGDKVTKGQVIVKLDDSTLKTQENQAKANAEYVAQNVTLNQAKLDQAQEDFDRATVQLQRKIIPQEQFDHLKQALAAARATYNIGLVQEKVAATQLGAVETSLAHTIVSAPSSGVVARKWTMPGDVVQPAQSIYTLYDLEKVWVQANFKETQVGDLKPGDRVTITVDAFPGRKFGGKVESIGAATAASFALIPSDNTSGNFTKVTQRVPVKIAFDAFASGAANPRLLPGMSAEVLVDTARD